MKWTFMYKLSLIARIKEKKCIYKSKTSNLNLGCCFRNCMAESLTKVMSIDINYKRKKNYAFC